VIDTETTGLSPRINKTLTVGLLLIDVNHEFLDILDQSHIFIKHKRYNSNSEAMKVNKIDLIKHNKFAIKPKLACKQINGFVIKNKIRQIPLVGHNICFDKSFLNKLFDKEGSLSKLPTEHEDTMTFWNALKKSGDVPYGLRNNLQTLAEYFKVDYSGAHDALADCHITANVYHKMLRLLYK